MANSKTSALVAQSDRSMEWAEQYCTLDLPEFQEVDIVNIKRTLDYASGLTEIGRDRVGRELIVELDVYLRFTRKTGGMVLGDPIYATTLLPGESVRLNTSDHRTAFTFDSESKLSYKSVQMSESQQYLSSLRHFSSDAEAEQGGRSKADYNSGYDFHGDAEGSVGFFSASGSVNARGSFNSHSVAEYLNSQRFHAQSAESNAVEATQKAMSVSIGEVNNRLHQEGTTEDHFEKIGRAHV